MSGWLTGGIIVAVIVAFAIVGQRYGLVDLSGGRRSGGSGLGSLDEVFFPTRHEAQQELARQTALPAPAPTPSDGDDDNDVFSGRVTIRL
jgi:hypothetical protein